MKEVEECLDPTTTFLESKLEFCPFCGSKLKVSYLTIVKNITTLTGKLRVKHTVKECPNPACSSSNSNAKPTPRRFQSEEFLMLSLPKCILGLDITLFIGFQMYFQHKSLNKVWEILQISGVTMNISTVYRQYQKFLIFLEGVSNDKITELQELFNKKGGYIIAIDAVRVKDSPPLFVCRELTTNQTLKTRLLKSESENEISPFLQELKEQFGEPIAIVSDMSHGISKAVANVFPKTKHQYCQFHFLKNLGKALLENDYDDLKGTVKKYKKN